MKKGKATAEHIGKPCWTVDNSYDYNIVTGEKGYTSGTADLTNPPKKCTLVSLPYFISHKGNLIEVVNVLVGEEVHSTYNMLFFDESEALLSHKLHVEYCKNMLFNFNNF